jgi:hypothetical protein
MIEIFLLNCILQATQELRRKMKGSTNGVIRMIIGMMISIESLFRIALIIDISKDE